MTRNKSATFQPTVRPDWAGAMSYIPVEERCQIFEAILKFPTINLENSPFWQDTVKPDLEQQYDAFIQTCEQNRRNVNNRWAKAKDTTVYDRNTSVYALKDKEKDKENVKDNIGDNIQSLSTARASNKFIPPTIDEVKAYAKQQNDMAGVGGFACTEQMAEEFWSNYAANGWITSNEARTPVRDWQAKLRQWAIREARNPQPKKKRLPA